MTVEELIKYINDKIDDINKRFPNLISNSQRENYIKENVNLQMTPEEIKKKVKEIDELYEEIIRQQERLQNLKAQLTIELQKKKEAIENVNKQFENVNSITIQNENLKLNNEKKIETSPETLKILNNIEKGSKLSTSELSKYSHDFPKYQQMLKNMENQSNQIENHLKDQNENLNLNNEKKIELTPELTEIFHSIERDSKLSSSELSKYYLSFPEYQQLFKTMESQSNQIKEKLRNFKLQNPQMSDNELFLFAMNNTAKNIIDNIKKDYGDLLTPEIIESLDKFNISIINNPDLRGDITAHPEKFQVEINNAHFATNVQDIESKITKAMGSMPHEIFHFVFRILKDEKHCDERMIYNLSNGEQASNFGMVGHMLNEGFVEKLSTDFCKRNNIYYSISPSYIQFTKLCDYITKNNPEVNESFLINNNYEGILNKFTTEAKEKYKETERAEYARNFKLNISSGEKRKVKDEEIVSSYNEKVQPKYVEQQIHSNSLQTNKVEFQRQETKATESLASPTPQNKSFSKRSESEIQIHQKIKQKNQMIKQKNRQNQQTNQPKARTLSAPQSHSSSDNKGYINVILISLIVSFACGALSMFVYYLLANK